MWFSNNSPGAVRSRLLVLVAILFPILVILFLYFSPADAKKHNNPELKPLYQDSTGWFVSRKKSISGQDVLSAYEFTPEIYNGIKANGLDADCLAQLLYLYENCPAFYHLFFLAVPDGMSLYWNDKSSMVLTYTCGKDTLVLSSTELFFATTSKPYRLLFVGEAKGGVSVPNSNIYSQQTWEDKKTGIEYSLPAVFARFEFRKMPDKLLSCAVSKVEMRLPRR